MVVEADAGEAERFSLLQCWNNIRSAYGIIETHCVEEVAKQGKTVC